MSTRTLPTPPVSPTAYLSRMPWRRFWPWERSRKARKIEHMELRALYVIEAIRAIKVELRQHAEVCTLNARNAVLEVEALERAEQYLICDDNITDTEAEVILYDIKRFLAEGVFQLDVRSHLKELPVPARHPSWLDKFRAARDDRGPFHLRNLV